MAYGLVEQIDRKMVHRWELDERKVKPWIILRKRGKRFMNLKSMKHRAERRRCRQDINCIPTYNKYYGWEW